MNKRLTALLTTAASLPLIAVTALGTAAPATAGSVSDCGAYPPGQAYGMRVSPGYAKVHRGSVISLSARVFRGGENCPDRAIGFYRRYAGQAQFHLDFRAGTDSAGLATVRTVVVRDFRFFGNYNSDASTLGARSPVGHVQVG